VPSSNTALWAYGLAMCVFLNAPFILFAYSTHREYIQIEKAIKSHVKPECRIIGDLQKN